MARIDRPTLRRIGRAVPAVALTAALTVAAVVSEDARIDPERFFAAERSGCIVDERAPLAETPVSEGEAQAAVERATDAEELGYVPGQIVVVYEEDATSSDRREAAEELGAEEVGQTVEVEAGSVVSLDIAEDMTVDDAVQTARESSAVKYALPNYVAETFDDVVATETSFTTVAGDDRVADQWHLPFVKAPQAWEALASCGEALEPVKVAVVDTGASLSHPDLTAVVNRDRSIEVVWADATSLASWTGLPLRGDGYTNGGAAVSEFTSHGTHVSGIVAAQAGNGGVLGVASGGETSYANELVDLVVIDAFSLLASNGKPNATLQDIVYALDHARQSECRVVNMSLGFVSDDADLAQFFDELCRGLTEKDDMLLVCAAGNSNARTKNYPAACDAALGVISISERTAVGSSSLTFRRPFWRGSDVLRSSFSNYGSWCDVSAPGESILSTYVRSGVTDGYATMSGTSMASPVVAGIAAMVRAAHPSLSATEVKELLCLTATDLYKAGKDEQTGYGAVDAEAAVQRALALRQGATEQAPPAPAPETNPAGPEVDAAPAPPAPEVAPSPSPAPETPSSPAPSTPAPATKRPQQSSESQAGAATKAPAAAQAPAAPAKASKLTVRKAARPTLRAMRRGFKVSWRKVSGNVSGYQVQYALDKKFKKSPKIKTLSKGKKSLTVKKLKAKKRYYVRVRAYYRQDGQKYYGKWSPARSVVTKK